jgi:hypothetical protein
VGLWLAGLIAAGLGAGPVPDCGAELFRVTRNTNANVVVYEARLASPGVLDERDPVHPVWIMLAEDGRREELNLVESAMAFGVEVREGEGAEPRVIAIRAKPDLAIRISVENGCPVARARIAGRDVRLRLVAVEAGGGLFPQVAHVDLIGRDGASGPEVRERYLPPE